MVERRTWLLELREWHYALQEGRNDSSNFIVFGLHSYSAGCEFKLKALTNRIAGDTLKSVDKISCILQERINKQMFQKKCSQITE